jgi:hypothetical protein
VRDDDDDWGRLLRFHGDELLLARISMAVAVVETTSLETLQCTTSLKIAQKRVEDECLFLFQIFGKATAESLSLVSIKSRGIFSSRFNAFALVILDRCRPTNEEWHARNNIRVLFCPTVDSKNFKFGSAACCCCCAVRHIVGARTPAVDCEGTPLESSLYTTHCILGE